MTRIDVVIVQHVSIVVIGYLPMVICCVLRTAGCIHCYNDLNNDTHEMDNAYPGDPVHADEGEHQDEDQGNRADDADIVDPAQEPRWGICFMILASLYLYQTVLKK